jgi:hypothetical protein
VHTLDLGNYFGTSAPAVSEYQIEKVPLSQISSINRIFWVGYG